MITNDVTYIQAHTRVADVKELVGFFRVDGICSWQTELLNGKLEQLVDVLEEFMVVP
jgi:hypothetical protein